MKRFIVTSEDQVTAVTSAADATEQPDAAGESFGTQAELASLTADWPASRLVAIWNTLPGVTAVKKFADHKTAVRRIWEKVHLLEGNTAAPTAACAPKRRAAGKAHKGRQKAATGRENTKCGQVIGLLKRAKGATLTEMMERTGWQAHTVRGFISAVLGKRMELTVESTRRADGARVYKISS
jgi:hypothetical protein